MNSDSPNETGVLADDNFKFEDILFFRLFIQIFFFWESLSRDAMYNNAGRKSSDHSDVSHP